ncbi:MAG: Ig-like domain-containing protein [Muribaculaceae bacterium]|nr:Ig-like domain-containing protein [Muribaculaceae bacterium]
MKRILIFLLAFAAAVGAAEAKKMSDLKIYINPGHGGYTSDDRPIRIYPFASNDSNGYWESKSNLYKGLHMYHILDSLGATPYLSRTKNTQADDRSLSGIAAEANKLDVDLFFSIHSNAGENVNYPLMLYREETEGVPRYEENITLSKIIWQQLHSNQLPVWSRNTEYIAGDLTFYKNMWSGGLGVLRTLYVVGLLSEGSMHEYRPEAHRLMNDDMWWLEAWHFVRGIMEFYNTEDRFVNGNVAGVVYDNHNLREYVMPANFSMLGRDKLAPLNGAYVELLDMNGNLVQKRTTDNMYNGVFVFRNVAPGNYKVRTSTNNYYTEEQDVTVTANEVTYTEFGMSLKREFPLEIVAYGPKVENDEPISCSNVISFEFNTDIDVESFEKAFKIEPDVEGYFTYSDSYHKATFTPNLSLARDTHYKVTVGKEARHPDPYCQNPNLENELSFEFTTQNRNRLEMTECFPVDGGEVHFDSPKIEFRFDNAVDATTIYKNIAITDSKGAAVTVSSRSTLYNRLGNGFGNIIYALASKLTPGETYSLTLGSELRDRENLPMGEDIVMKFTATDVSTEAGDAEVIETFEGTDVMFAYDPEKTTGIGSTLPGAIRSTEHLLGSYGTKLTYKFTDFRGGDITWNYLANDKIFNHGDKLGIHINGDFSSHEVLAILTSGTDVKYVSFGLMDYRGWQYKEETLDMLEEGFPYLLTGIRLVQTNSPVTQQGSFSIDNITRRINGSGAVAITPADNAMYEATPNPASDIVTVKAPGTINRLELINAAGACVALAENTNKISVAGHPAGIYLLRISCQDKPAHTLRIAVQ